jgi:uncharacterized protein
MANDAGNIYSELPGTAELPPLPLQQFEKRRRQRGENYRPRTRHLRPDGSAKYTNRLFLETSPYLLQHAHNPVNWYPWGEEAFDLARRLNRPVLVSIGYSTCHWCHVMEEESFEDEEIATVLNGNYIAVKVDREERPDLDAVYMNALQVMGSQGGWPLNVFLTPEQKPFYGGTYFPPNDDRRGIGFLSLLKRLRQAYDSDSSRVALVGGEITEAVRSILTPERSEGSAQEVTLTDVIQAYRDLYDPVNGGVRGAPKFPSSLPVRLLLREYLHSGNINMVSMVRHTLRRMRAGGIYDQVAGGFHRYATDEQWQIPHFEKMLYDNALLAVSYLEAYQVLGDDELALVVREILGYLQRDMLSPEGAFFAGTDADSVTESGTREEGFFFTWTPAELEECLGRERGYIVAACYGVTGSGNFEGRTVLHREKSISDLAKELNSREEAVAALLRESREILYQARSRRPPPLRDEKILASWNGLAVSAFARAGVVLDDQNALEQARKTALFILNNMVHGGRLARSHQGGEAKGEGFLEDYAFFIAGLIDLFEATGEIGWLERALELSTVVNEEFEDPRQGGYFMTGPHHETLIAREKPAYDGVVPSGNSVMIMNLLRLNALTEEPGYLERARRGLDAFASRLYSSPAAHSEMLLARDFLVDIPRQITIVAPQGKRQAAQGLMEKFRKLFLPNRVFILVSEGEELDQASRLVPFLRGKKANGDLAVAYVCRNRSCLLPTSVPEEFLGELQES